jgi:type II secretory pathway pseudopilin PulG
MARTLPRSSGPRKQRGLATLLVTLVVLGILTIVILYSTHVAFFEQRTTNNENRARLVEQAAEYSINLAGEYLAANRDYIVSNAAGTADGGGWLAATPETGRKWIPCSSVPGFPDIPNLSDGTPHPCMTESDAGISADYPASAGAGGRRGQLYFYGLDTSTGVAPSRVPYQDLIPDAAKLETPSVGVGEGAFPTQTTVRALLCRLDNSLQTPACRLTPVKGNRIAVTMVASVVLPGESAAATVKETWATLGAIDSNSSMPVIATGLVSTGGTITIVANPNAGGYGLPGSVWSPGDVQVENTTGGGAANISTCYIGDFMRGEPDPTLARAKELCPTNGSNPPCHCPSAKSEDDFWLSGSASGSKRENYDILDRDGGAGAPGNPRPPDIRFFPGAGPSDPSNPLSTPIALDKQVGAAPNTPASNAAAASDDSPFEYIFGVNYVVADHDVTGTTLSNCGTGTPATQNCADFAMRNDLGANVIEGDCAANQFDATSYGLYYVTGDCVISGATVGSANAPAIIVVFGKATLKNSTLFGMLFVHSNNIGIENASSGYRFDMQGATVFGALVVEGNTTLTGNSILVYDDTSMNVDPNKLPAKARFARVPGSWFDRQRGM